MTRSKNLITLSSSPSSVHACSPAPLTLPSAQWRPSSFSLVSPPPAVRALADELAQPSLLERVTPVRTVSAASQRPQCERLFLPNLLRRGTGVLLRFARAQRRAQTVGTASRAAGAPRRSCRGRNRHARARVSGLASKRPALSAAGCAALSVPDSSASALPRQMSSTRHAILLVVPARVLTRPPPCRQDLRPDLGRYVRRAPTLRIRLTRTQPRRVPR